MATAKQRARQQAPGGATNRRLPAPTPEAIRRRELADGGILRVTHRSQRGYQYPEFRIGGQYLSEILGVDKGDFVRWTRVNDSQMLLERCDIRHVPLEQRAVRPPRPGKKVRGDLRLSNLLYESKEKKRRDRRKALAKD